MDCFKRLFGSQPAAAVIPAPIKTIEQVTDIIKPSGKYSLLIDVSHYEPVPNYAKLKADGVSAVIAKASEHQPDSLFHAHVKAAQAAGLPVGGYHFMHASGDGLAQAELYLKCVMDLKLEIRHCLDWESGSADSQSSAHQQGVAKAWLDAVEKSSGHVPMIYMGYSFGKDLHLPESFARYPLWFARYTSAKSSDFPLPWKSYAAWQYTDSLKLDGLSGGHSCDASRADMSMLLI